LIPLEQHLPEGGSRFCSISVKKSDKIRRVEPDSVPVERKPLYECGV
jgi:hypothetical protein